MTKDRKKFSISIKDGQLNFSEKKSIKFWLNVIWQTFMEFCNGTNLHGFPQISDSDHDTGKVRLSKILHRISICFWSTMAIIGITFGIYLVNMVLYRNHNTPTITIIETSNYPISNLPFPSVALCSISPIWKPNIQNISKKLMNEGIEPTRISYFLGNLSNLITYRPVNPDLYEIFDLLENKYKYTAESIMKELVQPCDQLLSSCFWLSTEINCSTLFKIAKTELGYCCLFNTRALKVKNNVSSKNQIPAIRIAGAGEDIGLRLYININQTQYVTPKKLFSGVEIIISEPYDYPQKNFIASGIQPGYETAIGLKPSVFDTHKDLSSSKRLCIFFEEGNLTISPWYTYYSCIVEYRANLILSKCKCLPFFYPNADYLRNNYEYRICTFRDNKCLNTFNNHFHSIDIPILQIYDISDAQQEGLNCNCFPNCRATSYNIETFNMKRMNASKGAIFNVPSYKVGNQLGLLKVFYKQLSCIKYQRKIYMTWDDLMATIGGIYGLCLGGSVLSIVQIAYYIFIKSIEVFLEAQKEKEEKTLSSLIKYYLMDYPKPGINPIYAKKFQMKRKF